MKRYIVMLCISIIFIAVNHPVSAKPSEQQSEATEIALRALLSIGEETMDPDKQKCNLGSVYLHKINPAEKEPVKVNEPLIGELSEMTMGKNEIIGSCKMASADDIATFGEKGSLGASNSKSEEVTDPVQTHDNRTLACHVGFHSHLDDDSGSSTDYRFLVVDGKAQPDTLACVSTP